MIILKTLNWSNLFSYGADNTISLAEEAITQLVGNNGCLLGNTVVLSPDGKVNFIEELVRQHNLDVFKDRKYSSWGYSDNKVAENTITDFIHNNEKEVFCVQLDSGDKLNITANHQLLTYNRGWVPLSSLKIDDFILDVRQRPVDIIPQEEVDEGYWQLIGYLNTEGGLSNVAKKITFTNQDKNVAEHMRSLLRAFNPGVELVCTDTVRDYNYYINFSRSSQLKQEFIKYVTQSPNVVGYCTEKWFPDEVIRLPESTLNKLIAIYLDTDGCITEHSHLSFSTSSKKQAQQLLFILRHRYGLLTSIRTKKTTHSDNFEISITRLDQVHLLLKKISPFIISYKKERVLSTLNRTSSSSSYTQDLVPRSLLIDSLISNTTVSASCQKARNSLKNTKHGITRKNYELLRDNGLVCSLENFDNIKFLRIKNITSIGVHNVYDLTTTSSNFIADGILVHNSGKSSVPLILEEVLYNRNSKGIKKGDVPNRVLGTTKYSANCIFSILNKEYKLSIERSGATQKVKLLENNEDISSHTATATFAQIEELLGIDGKTFSQLVYQNSGSSLQFLTATDSNRKKFLIDLLSLDRYINVFEKVKVAHKAVSDTLIKLESKENTIRSWLATTGKTQLKEMTFLDVPVINSEKPNQLGMLQAQLAEIKSINTRINSNNLYRKKLESISAIDLVNNKIPIVTRTLEEKRTEVQLELKQYAATIKKYSGLTSGACPTCTQPIDTEKIKSIVDSAKDLSTKKRLDEQTILAELALAEQHNIEVSVHQALIKEFEQLSILIDNSLPLLALDNDNLVANIKELQGYISGINEEIARVTKSNNLAASNNAKVSAIKDQLESYTKELGIVLEESAKVTKQLSILEVLKKAFSTTGLIAYKIENSVKELESLTNDYLSELSAGRFELLFVLEKDKLNIVIVDNGKEIEITALSAGELARVTTSTLLAIRKLMSSLSKSRINILFLDEVIDVLDVYGKEKLIEVLLKEEGLNTFIISHTYTHPLVKKLEVIKEDGISRLNYDGG
jgi:intein/homing endonuclease